ncbi:MAG: hypothetical protein ACYCUM_07835 [Solirubrobacteraceae bacterium]
MGSTVTNVECVILTTLAAAFALALLLGRLKRGRRELAIGTQLGVGFVLRLLVIAGVAATGAGQSLRGPDELHWLAEAHLLAGMPWSSPQWLPFDKQSFLHVIVFAVQMKALGSPAGAMRIAQVGISMTGALLLLAAIHDLAGARAARVGAWILCLEPASLFFSSLLLKEPLMELGGGVLVLGASRVWRRLDARGIALMGLGCAIAMGARWYIGALMIACAVVIILHASLRQASGNVRALPLIYGMVAVIAISTPIVLKATSHRSLEENLQPIQGAESTAGTSTNVSGGHLALTKVNFSTREAIAENLPRRIEDVLLHPYPWQLSDTSQRLGAIGSIVALAIFALLIRFAIACRGEIMARAGPVIYPLLFLLIGYALATGNAGQGFRYRTHLVALAIVAMVTLRARVLEKRAWTDDRAPARGVPAAGSALVGSPSA